MEKNQTLCWYCAKALRGCSWSDHFEPIDGWDAEATVIHSGADLELRIDSYHVHSCPEYVDDSDRYNKRLAHIEVIKTEEQVRKSQAEHEADFEVARRCLVERYRVRSASRRCELCEYFSPTSFNQSVGTCQLRTNKRIGIKSTCNAFRKHHVLRGEP